MECRSLETSGTCLLIEPEQERVRTNLSNRFKTSWISSILKYVLRDLAELGSELMMPAGQGPSASGSVPQSGHSGGQVGRENAMQPGSKAQDPVPKMPLVYIEVMRSV